MTNALWCDIGQHPFPAGQPGSTQIGMREQVRNQWGGTQPHEVVKDVCAACAKDEGFRGLTKDVSDAELEAQADDIRDATGGRSRRLALPRGKKPVSKTAELEELNTQLRLQQLEDKLDDISFKAKLEEQ